METPNSEAGRVTERIMLRVREKLPQLPTHEYNRVYESVLAELELSLPKAPATPKVSTLPPPGLY